MSELIEVITTFGNATDARQVAAELVDRSLAACVQIGGPIESWYRWEGKIEESQEWTCHIKTSKELFSQVESCLKAMHPYDEPQVLAIDIEQTSASYGKWYREQLRTGGDS